MSKFSEWLQKVTGNIKSSFDNLFKKKDTTQTTQPAATTETIQPATQTQTTGMAKPNIAPKVDAVDGIKETPQVAAENTNIQDQSTTSQPNTPVQSNNFLDWYKSKTGGDFNGTFNRTENMSDQDFESGNALYQKYLQKQNLENQFNSANESIDKATDKQRQESSILRDKMAKYINLQNKNTGLENMGVGESTKLQADTTYMNNLGKIESDAQAQKQGLLDSYMNNQTNIDIESAQEQQGIMDKYQQLAREDEQKEYDRQQDEYNKQKYEEEQAYKREQDALEQQRYADEQAKAQQQTNFNEFMAVVESGSFNTAAELESFYAKYKDKLSPEQQATAEQYINFYKNNPDQQEIDKEVDKNKPQVKENPDGTKTEITDNGDGTTTEKTIDQNGNVVGEKTGLKIDTSSGHSRYTTSDGSTISSPSGGAKFNITYGSNNNDHANNYDITYNGNKYKVEVGKEFAGTNAQLQEIYSYMKQVNGRDTIEEGDYVLYNGELYIASNTGRLWTVQDRSKFWAWNWGGKTASDLRAEMQRDFG